ncbi:MAG TPA: hypothetical protein VF041_05140 [Gemmatimonadaceae bacterium]
MKRFVILLLALAACSHAARPATGLAPDGGEVTARRAVESFLGAVRAQDLQAMSLIWGTSKGPARDVVDRAQLEKRELIMQCYLGHDSFRILTDTPQKPDTHVLQVSLTKGTITRETTFTAVLGPHDRWYVQDAELEPVRDLCATG